MHRIIIRSLFLAALVLTTAPSFGQTVVPKFLGQDVFQWGDKLGDGNAQVRRSAAFALGKLGQASSVQLGKMLEAFGRENDSGVKEAIAFAIGEICKASPPVPEGPQIVQTMSSVLMSDADPLVKRSAAYAIGCLGPSGVNGLTALDNAVTNPKSTPTVKQNAAWALGQIGKAGVISLVKLLKDDQVKSTRPEQVEEYKTVVRDAANSLGKVAEKLPAKEKAEILKALAPHLGYPDVEAKKSVVVALNKVADPAHADLVSAPLQALVVNAKENSEVRLNAAVTLAAFGGEKAAVALNALLDVLDKGDIEEKRLAAAVIGNIGRPAYTAVPALKKALKDKDAVIKLNAATSLGNIGAAYSPADPKNAGKPIDPNRSFVTVAVPALIDILENAKENHEVRKAAAIALKEMGPCDEIEDPRATNVLISTIGNSSLAPELRAVAMWPIRLHKNIANLDNLFTTLNGIVETPATDKTKMLRYDSAFLLGKYKRKNVSAKVMDTLLEFLRDDQVFIALGVGATAGTKGETGVGGTKVDVIKGGDGRIIALNALTFIVNEKGGGDPAKVTARKDIMAQLQVLAKTAKDANVSKQAKDILDYVE
jgi:HEAT repeat protein